MTKYSIARIKLFDCTVAKAFVRTPCPALGTDVHPSIRLKTLKATNKPKLQFKT